MVPAGYQSDGINYASGSHARLARAKARVKLRVAHKRPTKLLPTGTRHQRKRPKVGVVELHVSDDFIRELVTRAKELGLLVEPAGDKRHVPS